MAQKKNSQEERQDPAFDRRLNNIRVAVWLNQKENGDVWYNTKITRSYYDGNAWQDAITFSRDDLPCVEKAAAMAYSWIWDQMALDPGKQKAAA